MTKAMIRKNIYGALICLGALFVTPLQANETNFSLDSRLVGGLVSEDLSETRKMGLRLVGDLRHEIHPHIRADLRAFAHLESGNAESIYFNPYQPNNDVGLREGSVFFQPSSWASVRLGVQDQTKWENPLLLGSRGFPALEERIGFDTKQGGLWLTLQQAIPTGNTQNRFYSSEPTGSTYLGIEEIRGTVRPHSRIRLMGKVFHFDYQDLPREIANESRFLGNSVRGLTDQNAEFVYRYDGWGTGGQLEFFWGPETTTRFGGNFLNNWSGPVTKNQAWNLFLNTTLPLWSTEFTPRIEYFVAEADSAPASYSNASYGFKNRQGVKAGLLMRWKKTNFFFSTDYVNASPILENPLQSDLQNIEITIGKVYEIL